MGAGHYEFITAAQDDIKRRVIGGAQELWQIDDQPAHRLGEGRSRGAELARLAEQHPGLEIDARFSDAYVDLIRDGIDVAIRAGEMQDSTLVARRFASQQLVLVAAPSYLRAQGEPRSLEDLSAHRHILFRMPTSGRERPQQFTVKRKTVSLHPARGMRLNDGEAMVQAAVLGAGLAQVPDYMAAADIAAGRLVEVLAGHRPPEMAIYAVMPASRMVPPRVRVLLDALEAWPPAR